FALAARFSASLAKSVIAKGGLPIGTTLNINVPGGTPTRHQMTYVGHRSYRHSIHKRTDPRGAPYYWIGGMPDQPRDMPGSDCNAVADGIISVTPLTIDATHKRAPETDWRTVTVAGFEEVASEPAAAEHGYDPKAK